MTPIRKFQLHAPLQSDHSLTKLINQSSPFLLSDGNKIYSFELPVRNTSGSHFKPGVVTHDGQMLVFLAADKGSRDALVVFNAKTGALCHKIPMRQAGVKDAVMIVAMPNKSNLVAVIDPDKGSVFDIKTKRLARTIPKWGGMCTRDGKTGLYAPSRFVNLTRIAQVYDKLH